MESIGCEKLLQRSLGYSGYRLFRNRTQNFLLLTRTTKSLFFAWSLFNCSIQFSETTMFLRSNKFYRNFRSRTTKNFREFTYRKERQSSGISFEFLWVLLRSKLKRLFRNYFRRFLLPRVGTKFRFKNSSRNHPSSYRGVCGNTSTRYFS